MVITGNLSRALALRKAIKHIDATRIARMHGREAGTTVYVRTADNTRFAKAWADYDALVASINAGKVSA